MEVQVPVTVIDIVLGGETGMDAYLCRPINIETLLETLVAYV
ncbi:MAG: DNA-binding response OmpR family regulator [Enterobacterales bacterium]|jgi:DNA-binding response OmpR family regulator